MFPFSFLSQAISRLGYRLSKPFRAPNAWGLKIIHLFMILALLLPYVTALADVATNEHDGLGSSGGRRLSSEHAKPGTPREKEEVSYEPPKINRPEPRVVVRVVEAPAQTDQDTSLQVQPTPMADHPLIRELKVPRAIFGLLANRSMVPPGVSMALQALHPG